MRLNRFLIVLPWTSLFGIHAFPQQRQAHYRRRAYPLSGNPNSSNNDDFIFDQAENLLKVASRLRQEAEILKSSISENRITSNHTYMQGLKVDPVATSEVASYWTLAYRFSSEPTEPTDNTEVTNINKARYYTGKVNIHLLENGYTEFRNQDSEIQFTKFWGWDEEVSSRDNKRYLMFSADALIPPNSNSSSLTPENTKRRFYFNARIDIDEKTGYVELNDGTVTIKRDVLSNQPKLLSFFNAGSILAEFKKCGTFICKPCLPFSS